MAVNLLLSYAFHSGTDLRKVRRELVCGNLMVDSGAFTAWSKGDTIDRLAYAEFLEHWQGTYDHAITLDVVGDPASTTANTRWLHSRGLAVMPVFTPGMTLADFDAMVKDAGYVCVGGLVGTPPASQVSRTRMLQRRAQDAGGGIHALGIGSPPMLLKARPYSSDSSSVSLAFKFGIVVFYDGRIIRRVVITDRATLNRHRDQIRAHGIDLADLATTGRMPVGVARQKLMQAMSLAYAAADEHLKTLAPVRAPGPGLGFGPHLYNSVPVCDAPPAAHLDTELHRGPHLYNSVITDIYAGAVTDVDRQVHGNAIPRIWAAYARNHVCTTRKIA